MAKTTSILSLAGAALALSVAGASAADLPVKAPMMAPVQVYDWSGWYAGVGLGGSWSEFDWVYLNGNTPAPRRVERDDPRAELHGGAQYQFGGFGWGGLVVGYEYSASFSMDSYGRQGSTCPNPAFICQAKLENIYTIGGKLGLAWDRFMLYGTGGYAGGNVTTQGLPVAGGFPVEHTKNWHNGWYVGGGLDYSFYRTAGTDWILGVDYKHVELDTVFHGVTPGNINPDTDRNITPTSDVLLGRLTVKFQGPLWPFSGGAVAARY